MSFSATVPKAAQQEMEAARLDLGYRDHCAHLLIPLNECRQQTSYMPWSCQDLRHAYEKCQYDEYACPCLSQATLLLLD